MLPLDYSGARAGVSPLGSAAVCFAGAVRYRRVGSPAGYYMPASVGLSDDEGSSSTSKEHKPIPPPKHREADRPRPSILSLLALYVAFPNEMPEITPNNTSSISRDWKEKFTWKLQLVIPMVLVSYATL